jgi:hypothetical protein
MPFEVLDRPFVGFRGVSRLESAEVPALACLWILLA